MWCSPNSSDQVLLCSQTWSAEHLSWPLEMWRWPGVGEPRGPDFWPLGRVCSVQGSWHTCWRWTPQGRKYHRLLSSPPADEGFSEPRVPSAQRLVPLRKWSCRKHLPSLIINGLELFLHTQDLFLLFNYCTDLKVVSQSYNFWEASWWKKSLKIERKCAFSISLTTKWPVRCVVEFGGMTFWKSLPSSCKTVFLAMHIMYFVPTSAAAPTFMI